MSHLSLLLRRFSASRNQTQTPIPPGPPILFLHMPKTAGTSVRKMLQASLGMNAVYPSDEELQRRPSGYYPSESEILESYPSLPRYFVLAGHFLATFVEQLPIAHRTAVFLRDPVCRSLSTLAHFHRTSGVTPDQLLDDPIFVEHHIRNFQTAVLGKKYGKIRDKVSSRTFDDALVNLDSFDFVGLTERFAESCKLFDTVFGTVLQSVIVKENVLRPRGTELSDLIPRILPLVELDQRLYEHATARFRMEAAGAQSPATPLRRAA